MILTNIIERKRIEIEESKERISLDELRREAEAVAVARHRHAFEHAISKPGRINLIAEVKKASPSAGVLRRDFDPLEIALTYEANGASAISVLTDEKFFQGKLDHLEMIKRRVSLPVLRKDFIIDEYQLYESVKVGADAVLLIADLFSEDELKRFMEIGVNYNLDFLVEVHSEEDTKKAVGAGARIIGINNRDLRTFKVDVKTTTRLLKMIPDGTVRVSESGIRSKEVVLYLKSLGVNAVLVGEVFMRSENIGEKVREFLS